MPRKRPSQPAFKPTDDERRMVGQMSAQGFTHEDIGRVIRNGIDDTTLRMHFREELDTGAIRASAKIGGALYNQVLNADTTAAIWWSKISLTRKETSDQEHTGPDGGPTRTLDTSKLTTDQLIALKKALI